MSKEEVEKVYNKGNKLLHNFAGRLFTKYFSEDDKCSLLSELDPIRVGFIKEHLVERNGGPLNAKQWYQCRHTLSKYLSVNRSKYAAANREKRIRK